MLVQSVLRDLKGLWEKLEQPLRFLVPLVRQVPRVIREPRVRLVQPQLFLVLRVQLDLKETLDFRVILAQPPRLLVPLARRDPQVHRALKAIQVMLDLLVHRESKVQLALLVRLVRLGYKAFRALRDLLDLLAQRVRLVILV